MEERIAALLAACKAHGPQLDGCVTHNDKPIDGTTLLWAIAGNESNFGELREYVREEKGYMPRGHYFKTAKHVRDEHRRWGVLASSSFGSFQLMYPVAYELGYRQHPILLQSDVTCAAFAAKLILNRFAKAQGAKTLADILDAYNTGNSKDRIVPEAYIEKGTKFYEAGLPK